MRIQVVIPSYNQGRFIGDAVRSVAQQAPDVDLELVVVDGASTDNSLSEVERALQDYPGVNATIISEPDDGQPDAINKGVARGGGEVVSWLNSDDLLLPGALTTVARAFEQATPDVAAIYGDVRHIDEDGHAVREYREQGFRRYDLIFGPVYVPQPSTFISRWAWDRVGGVREDLHYALDPDMWMRLSRVGRIGHVPEILSEFRWHSESKSGGQRAAQVAEVRRVNLEHAVEELGRRPSVPEYQLRRVVVRARRRLRFARRAVTGTGT